MQEKLGGKISINVSAHAIDVHDFAVLFSRHHSLVCTQRLHAQGINAGAYWECCVTHAHAKKLKGKEA